MTYIQNFNKGPEESVIASGLTTCSSGLFIGSKNIRDSTCTLQYDNNGKLVEDSQGFCCSCPLLSLLFGIRGAGQVRGDCGFMSDSHSAHCLKFPNEWWAGYRIGKYQFKYYITISVESEDKEGNIISNEVFLSPSNKVVENPYFIARLIGDFMPSTPPSVLEEQILLRPFHPVDSTSPDDRWLLVDPSMVTLQGDECNKIGVGFSAF